MNYPLFVHRYSFIVHRYQFIVTRSSLFTSYDDYWINFAGFSGGKKTGEIGGNERKYDSNDVKHWAVIDRVSFDGGQCGSIERDLVDEQG